MLHELRRKLMACIASVFLFFSICISLHGGPVNAEILDYTTKVSVRGTLLIKEVTYLISINNRLSDDLAEISIPFRGDSKPELLFAEVLDSKGSVVRKLGKKDAKIISNISNYSLFEDHYLMELNMGWNTYPYQVRYSYRITEDKFISLDYWTPVVADEITTRRASLELIVPPDYKFRVFVRGSYNYSTDTLEDNIIHKWVSENYLLPDREAYSPASGDLKPKVLIVPLYFKYGVSGSNESWNTYGNWISNLNEGLFELTQEEKDRINSLTAGLTDTRSVARVLYHFMQDNTRYVNVSIDIGGLKPYPAYYVCKNKYGDCKALTIYMMAILKYKGIRSVYSLVNAGDDANQVITGFPSAQANHVILFIPLVNDTIWIENTSQLLPFGYTGTFTQNRYTLAVDGQSSRLIRTPALSMSDVRNETTIRCTAEPGQLSEISFSKKVRGSEFEAVIEYNAYADEARKRDMILKLLPRNTELKELSIHQPDRDSAFAVIYGKASIGSFFRSIENSLVFSNMPLKLPELAEPSKRKTPVSFQIPVSKYDSIIIKIPESGRYKIQIPQKQEIITECGRFEMNFSLDSTQVIASSVFELFTGYYEKDNYTKLYNFIESVRKSLKSSAIILTPIL